jgi:hypothetical protein
MLAEIFLLQLEADIRASEAVAGADRSNRSYSDATAANRMPATAADRLPRAPWRHPFAQLSIMNGKL